MFDRRWWCAGTTPLLREVETSAGHACLVHLQAMNRLIWISANPSLRWSFADHPLHLDNGVRIHPAGCGLAFLWKVNSH